MPSPIDLVVEAVEGKRAAQRGGSVRRATATAAVALDEALAVLREEGHAEADLVAAMAARVAEAPIEATARWIP